jgi:hypothetical protein
VVRETGVAGRASPGLSASGTRQRVPFGFASVATSRRPSLLAASDVYRSRPVLTRCGTPRSTSRLCSHGPEPSLSLARYMSVRGFNITGWLTRALWCVIRSGVPPVDRIRQMSIASGSVPRTK